MGSILKGDWVSDCCLATQQFFSYIMEILVNFHWGDKEVHFVLTNTLSCIFYIASSLKQQFANRHVALLGHILIPSQPIFPLSPQCCLLIREAKKNIFTFFGFTRLWLEPTIYRTRTKHANHYTTDARGGSRGAHHIFSNFRGEGVPPKIGKNMICWRKIVIFHTKYPKLFAPPSARRNFFKCAPPNLKSWMRYQFWINNWLNPNSLLEENMTSPVKYILFIFFTFNQMGFSLEWYFYQHITKVKIKQYSYVGTMPLVDQELLTLPNHLSSPPVISGVRVTRSLVLCVCFVNLCLSFCHFYFGHCVVCSSSIYGFWLPLWYLQTRLPKSNRKIAEREGNLIALTHISTTAYSLGLEQTLQ